MGLSYSEVLNRHLASYKHTQLGIIEAGIFRYRGRDLAYPHILPVNLKHLNLLEPARQVAFAYMKTTKPLKLHKYFHHLNSSQAFAFNLFFPYFGGGQAAATCLLRAFGQQGDLENWEPEAVPVESEGTNIDVRWRTSEGIETFCEVKLSEGNIGKAANDARHRRKFETIYAQELTPYFEPALLEPARFCSAYQFYRNVWHAARVPKAKALFLLPRSNFRLWKDLQALIDGVKGGLAARISMIAVEDLLERLQSDRLAPEALRLYAKTLADKYLVLSA